jgi:ubiquinone/menaquinone biosynthesis C-methylase UbiE
MTDAAPPAPPNPNQMPAAWSEAAPGYAQFIGSWLEYAHEALRLVPVRASDDVLDVATGPGTLALLAAPKAAHVVAVDFSPGMLKVLEARAAAANVRNIETGVMDAQALALDDGRFDAAYCLFGFMFFPDRARAFRELCRVLEPGGRALVATWAPIERRPLMKVGFDALAEALPQLPLPTKGDLQSVEECEAEMSAAGFRDVKAHTVTARVAIESAESYLDATARGSAPFVMMKKKLGAQAWAAVEQRLLGALRKRIPVGGTSLTAEALLTVGTR